MHLPKYKPSPRRRAEIPALIRQGRSKSSIPDDEISQALPEDSPSPERLAAALQPVDEAETPVLESLPEEEKESRLSAAEGEESPPTAPPSSSGAVHDSVRLYLKQMGDIPLLSREDELRLAKRIEI